MVLFNHACISGEDEKSCGKHYYVEQEESSFSLETEERGTAPQHELPNGNRIFFNLTEGIAHNDSYPMDQIFESTMSATLIAPIDVEEDGKIDFVV